MPEPPITTIGQIQEVLGPRVYRASLPNGKLIHGHLPQKLSALASDLTTGSLVHLEMTPYDFEKARIVALVNHA